MKTKIEDISKDLDDLDLEGAKSLIIQLLQKIEVLSEDQKHLLHRLYGKKSEQIDPNQLRLWGGDETMAALESSPEPSSDKPKKKAVKKGGHGRKAFADHLERERIECVLRTPSALAIAVNSCLLSAKRSPNAATSSPAEWSSRSMSVKSALAAKGTE